MPGKHRWHRTRASGIRRHPTRAWRAVLIGSKFLAPGVAVLVLAACTSQSAPQKAGNAATHPSVPGESYLVCPTHSSDGTDTYTSASTKYLTSPWTYDAPLDTNSPNY